jgi:RimJ/RimL family protein N-acetyltransferase
VRVGVGVLNPMHMSNHSNQVHIHIESNRMTIRTATPSDAEALHSLRERVDKRLTSWAPLSPPWVLEGIIQSLAANDPRNMLVAELQDSGAFIGHCTLAPGLNPSVREITIHIHPDHHRQGYGREVLNALIEEGRRIRLARIRAHIHPENRPSIQLFASRGFCDSGTKSGELCVYLHEVSSDPIAETTTAEPTPSSSVNTEPTP